MKKNSYLLLIPLGVFMFIVAFGIYTVFDRVLNKPSLGGALLMFFLAATFAAGSKLVPRFGAFTIISLVFTILCILFLGLVGLFAAPLQLMFYMGIALSPAFIIDIWVLIFGFKDWARCSGIMIVFTICGMLLTAIGSLFRVNNHIIGAAALVSAVGSLVGALIGIVLFERGLRKIKFIKGLIHDRSKSTPIPT